MPSELEGKQASGASVGVATGVAVTDVMGLGVAVGRGVAVTTGVTLVVGVITLTGNWNTDRNRTVRAS
jgi:hypothetical protein